MTDKKIVELGDADLDNVQGGASQAIDVSGAAIGQLDGIGGEKVGFAESGKKGFAESGKKGE
ncbi:hypothetical protein [Parasphingopyxis marina]|uniref:Uncharacterized protein n=1 Tax=Parasphingopyxis marina TaxID=2761622 RepID=A0A842I0H7_9SPHN|nr:hypothetical protein [Parasphingopyxis marina]MBC2778149.1 hypothetical protein [Parasphingopyxis marina]